MHAPLPDDPRLKKLRFRAWRRGFREADLILGPFADRELAAMPAGDLDAFEALLEVADQDLYYWIIGREPPAPEHDTAVLRRIQAFHLTAYADGPHTGGG